MFIYIRSVRRLNRKGCLWSWSSESVHRLNRKPSVVLKHRISASLKSKKLPVAQKHRISASLESKRLSVALEYPITAWPGIENLRDVPDKAGGRAVSRNPLPRWCTAMKKKSKSMKLVEDLAFDRASNVDEAELISLKHDEDRGIADIPQTAASRETGASGEMSRHAVKSATAEMLQREQLLGFGEHQRNSNRMPKAERRPSMAAIRRGSTAGRTSAGRAAAAPRCAWRRHRRRKRPAPLPCCRDWHAGWTAGWRPRRAAPAGSSLRRAAPPILSHRER